MPVRRSIRRGVGAVVGLLAAATVILGGASAASARVPDSEAATCLPYVAILPAFAQHRDMALGLPNGPLADRDSSGISFAESWQERPSAGSSIKIVNRLKEGNVEAAASINTGDLPADAVISEPTAAADRWFKESVNGFVKYRNANNNDLYITYVPGDPTAPFRARNNGTPGQLFKVEVLGC
jgi:hypothetical protein